MTQAERPEGHPGPTPGARRARLTPSEVMLIRAADESAGQASSGRGWSFWRRVFGVCALLGTAVGVWRGTPTALRSWASARWATTEGVVEALEFTRHVNEDGQETYAMSITYAYSVDGRSHRASRRRFGFEPDLGERGKSAAQSSFAQGTTVTVAYDPDDPDQAVLEQGPGLASHFALLASLAGLLLGLALLAPSRPPPVLDGEP